MKAASILPALPSCKPGSGGWKTIWVWIMRLSPAFALLFAASLAVTGAQAADTLTLARKLVQYTGGVSAILHNFEGGMAQKTAAPDVFVQSFLQASVENKAVLDAADEKLAQAYAKIYP